MKHVHLNSMSIAASLLLTVSVARAHLAPNLGRFSQRDPLEYRDGQHLYLPYQARAGNSLDPTGMCCPGGPRLPQETCDAWRAGHAPGGDLRGIVLCVNGQKGYCLFPPNRGLPIPFPGVAQGDSLSAECTAAHENTHINENHSGPCRCGTYAPDHEPPGSGPERECSLRQRDLICLESQKHRCDGAWGCLMALNYDQTMIIAAAAADGCTLNDPRNGI
jgi:hypothetical protein